MDPSGEEEEEEKYGYVGDGKLRVDVGIVMRFRNLHGIPWISISDGDFRHLVALKPGPVSSRTRTKYLNIN